MDDFADIGEAPDIPWLVRLVFGLLLFGLQDPSELPAAIAFEIRSRNVPGQTHGDRLLFFRGELEGDEQRCARCGPILRRGYMAVTRTVLNIPPNKVRCLCSCPIRPGGIDLHG